MARVWLLGCLLLLCSASARADTYVIAPPAHQGTNGNQVAELLVNSIWAYLNDRTVILPNQAVERMPNGQRTWCAESECMERYRVANSAVAAFSVRVFRVGTGPGLATSFQITLQPRPGLEYVEGMVIDPSKMLEDQAKAVLEKIWRRYENKDGQPRLIVTGAPAGAVVYVDDELKGPIPAYLTLSVGTHRVRMEKTGYETGTRVVSLQTAGSESEMDIRLAPEGRTPPPPPLLHVKSEEPRLSRKHRWGISLLSVGVPMLAIAGAYAAVLGTVDTNECASSEAPLCSKRGLEIHRDQKLAASLSIGGIGLVSTIVGAVLVKRERNHLRASVSAGAQSAVVTVRRDF